MTFLADLQHVYFGIGSNLERKKHIQAGISELAECFPHAPLRTSSVYESDALGFDGPPFYNLVAMTATPLSLAEVQQRIREIESRYGRSSDMEKFSSRTLDIDILMYGDYVQNEVPGREPQLPRSEILTSAFVLKPLAELAPHVCHPVSRTPFQRLWKTFQEQEHHQHQHVSIVTEAMEN